MAVLLVWGGILLAERIIEMTNEQRQQQRRATAAAINQRRRHNGGEDWHQPRFAASVIGQEHTPEEERPAWTGPPPPQEYVCPISLELMEDPVIIETGMTFDRPSISSWFARGRSSCPLTNRQLESTGMCANTRLCHEIRQWKAEKLKDMPAETIDDVIARVRSVRAARFSGPPAAALAHCDSLAPPTPQQRRRRSGAEVQDMAGALDMSLEQLNSDRMLGNLVELLRSPAVGPIASAVLEWVADQDECDRLRVVAAGALPVLAEMLQQGGGEQAGGRTRGQRAEAEQQVHSACGLLKVLCVDSTIRQHAMGAGIHKQLVGVMAGPDTMAQVLAADALRSLVQAAPASALRSLADDLLQPLLQMVRADGVDNDCAGGGGDGSSTLLAVEALGMLAMANDVAVVLADSGLLPTLVRMMRGGSSGTTGGGGGHGGARRRSEKAVFCTYALSMHALLLPKLHAAGAAPALVAHLRGGATLQTQAHAAGAVMYLVAAHGACRQAIVAEGAVEPLVALLTASSRRCQAHAAAALSCLGEDQGVSATVGSKGGMASLVRMMEAEEDTWLQETAADAAATLIRRSVNNQRRLLDAGGLGPIMRMLAAQQVSPFALTAGCLCVAILAGYRSVREALLFTPDAMAALRQLSRHGDADTAAAARSAIHAVSEVGVLPVVEPFPAFFI